MTMIVAFRIARRELRAGLHNFRIFLLCLTLGIAAIAAVGSVRQSIEQGLSREGAVILGGDAEMQFTYRFASRAEKRWMNRRAIAVSKVVDFRSMAVIRRDGKTERGLTQVKAVDGNYPIYGTVKLAPNIALARAFAPVDAVPGGVMQPLLADKLGLQVGDMFWLGTQKFRLSALLLKEPDAGAQRFGLGPRTIVRTVDLAGSGLIGPGSLFQTKYRLKLPEKARLGRLKHLANQRFRDKGLRWRDRRRAAPGIEKFVDRIGSFLVLVGLAGLAVGGIGISAAVRSYLEGKTAVIATLKTLGATSGMIFRIYFIQIAALSALGIVLGLALGAVLPLVFAPLLASSLPLPTRISVQVSPLIEAALYGGVTALLFTLWPIARSGEIRPAALFRDNVSDHRFWPRWPYILLTLLLLGALVGLAVWFAAMPRLALWTFGGIAVALAVLVGAAFLVKRLAARLARSALVRGKPALRLALAAIGGPASDAAPVILSLGLGLAVLAAIGQIDTNLRGAIADNLPKVAPSFFFVDIQNDQIAGFLARTRNDSTISRVEAAPMLRGVITRLKGRPAREVAGNSWVVTGDRGVTFSAKPPKRTIITKGKWWPENYQGPPLVSFAAHQAKELGLNIGDQITLNILGRDINATIASFRKVDFTSAGMGFVLAINPSAVAGAPHTTIATVYQRPSGEAALLRDIGDAYPNVTAIRVQDAIERVASMLRGLAAATSYGALATLVTGFVVLIGAAATGEGARQYEAAILKTLGAGRGRILLSFALRAAILGAAAGTVAIVAGAASGWGVMRFVMQTPFHFEPVSAIAIVFGGALVTVIAGLFFALRSLSARPASVLRARE